MSLASPVLDRRFTRVQFRTTFAALPGEALFVSGPSTEFGSGHIPRTNELTTSREQYPVYTNGPSFVLDLPNGVEFEYNYAIFSGGVFNRFETVPPRKIVTEGGLLMVTETVNEPGGVQEVLAGGEAAEEDEDEVPVGGLARTRSGLRAPVDELSSADSGPAIPIRPGTDGVVIVQYQLPIKLTKTETGWEGEWDDENLLARKRHTIPDQLRVLWIGVPFSTSPIEEADEQEVIDVLDRFRCVPVFLSKEQNALFYEGYCKDTIWPVFHNVVDVYGKLPTRWWNRKQQEERWNAYTLANQQFAKKVVEKYHDGDLVWIHDYPLLLLPSFLAHERVKSSNIGFFLHTPFPSSEIFRSLSVRDNLLRGMLNADHIGFHLFEYARHFLTSCRRLLGLTHSILPCGRTKVEVQGRDVIVTVSHVGIEPDLITERAMLPKVTRDADALKARFAGRRIIAGIDNTERLKGISLKFNAFDLFLTKYPVWRDKVVLVQVGIREKSLSADCGHSEREIESLVKLINDKHARPGCDPVLYFHIQDTVSLNDRIPLCMAADVLMTTGIRDGLNLLPLEYCVARRSPPGVLIISEFTGCGRVLVGAIPVNPWQQEQMVAAIHHALTMPDMERAARYETNMEAVMGNTTSQWAERMLQDLKQVSIEALGRRYETYGLALSCKVVAVNSQFKSLTESDVFQAYKRASRRIFFLDYGGTLNTKQGVLQERLTFLMGMQGRDRPIPLTDDMQAVLKALAADPRNTVFIISGKERSVLLDAFSELPAVGLAAEHGYYYRWGSVSEVEAAGSRVGTPLMAAGSATDRVPADRDMREWHIIGEHMDMSWQDIGASLMEVYSQRTNGTFVLRKGSCVLWHHGDADPDFGELQAKELQEHLTSVLKHFPVDVLTGKEYVEIRPKGVNKGVIACHILDIVESYRHSVGSRAHVNPFAGAVGSAYSTLDDSAVIGRAASHRQDPVDFIMAIGDDSADELMFSELKARMKNRRTVLPSSLFTVTVGKKPSNAEFYLEDTMEVEETLKNMTKLGKPLAAPPTIRNMSMVDLHNLAKMGASKSERPFPRITEFPPITHRSAISMSSVRIGFSQFMERADDDEPPTMD